LAASRNDWDWWSEVKLGILDSYLRAFTTAVCGRSSGANYLDLFAGSYLNNKRHADGMFPGSSRIALETQPAFTRLAFIELPKPAGALEHAIESDRPGDARWKVVPGDCNLVLQEALAWLAPQQWAPTFAFIDPKGMQVAWATIQALAEWRSAYKTKVELWILFPEPALARVLGLRGVRGLRSAERLTRLYGTDEWRAIHWMRQSDEIDAATMRAEFINLLRWRLEQVLGYRTTHALQMATENNRPVYTMVFATDSKPGDDIMQHIYNNAATRTLPAMAARARAMHARTREKDMGMMQLFDDMNTVEPRSSESAYENALPWRPPTMPEEVIAIDFGDDVDPDKFDLYRWLDDNEDL
jgi:three-Cys-motif partner protein